MATTARVLNIVIRACGGATLALGFALWLGYARASVDLHIGLGVALVLALFSLAGIAWKATAHHGLAARAAGWGIITWLFGITQTRMLPVSLHWLVEVTHLVVGIAAIALGSRLARVVVLAAKGSMPSTSRDDAGGRV